MQSLEPPPAKVHAHVWMAFRSPCKVLRGRSRRRTIDQLLKDDGPYCRAKVCYYPSRYVELQGANPEFRYVAFSVNHLDMDRTNQSYENLALAHWHCNRVEESAQAQLHSSSCLTHTPTHTETLRALEARREEVRNDPTASAGHKANQDHEPDYRRACFEFVLRGVRDRDYRFNRSEMNASAREVSDSGRDAAYGYAARLFSKEGPLTDKDPVTGKKGEVRFKDPDDYGLAVDRLEAKYPKEGKAFAQEGSR